MIGIQRRRKKRTPTRRGRTRLGWTLGLKRRSQARSTRYSATARVARRDLGRSLAPPQMIAVALLVAASLLVVWFSSDDMFYIRSIKIAGNLRVPDTELIKTTGLGGINVFWVETQAAEKALQALPDVMSARVRCTLPADCAINLVERPVLFVWRQGDAHAWIATDGTVLPARGAMADAVVLDAAGSAALKPGDRLDSNLVLAVQELARLQPQVREYTYSDRYGLIFRDSQDWTIRLGHGEQTAVKLELLRALTTFFVEQSIEPTLVDVRYPDAPYYIE